MNQVSGFVQSPAGASPKTARGRRTRQNLLEAAEKEFGERGYHEAAINRITEGAGVAMGTFYVHFESKEAIFRALVAHMSHLTRRWISERIADAPNRLAAERLGLEIYIDYVRRHPGIYRIIDEAQFVAPEAYREHYSKFVRAYRRRLKEAVDKGEIRPGDDEKRAWALIGAGVFLGMRYGVWDTSQPVSEAVNGAAEFFELGLKPDKQI